jgi:hypothetical protein
MIVVPAAKKGLYVIGIDISSRALCLLKTRLKAIKLEHRVELVLGYVTTLPIRDELFDAAVCSSVLLHVDGSRALPEIKRIVRRSGRIWIDSLLNKYHPDNIQVIFAKSVFRTLGKRTSVPLVYYSLGEIRTTLHVNNLKVVSMQSFQSLPLPFSYRAPIPQILERIVHSTGRLFQEAMNLPQLARRYGEPFEVLKAIGTYGELKTIEAETKRLSTTRDELKNSVGELEVRVQSLKATADEIQRSITVSLKSLSSKVEELPKAMGKSFLENIEAIQTKCLQAGKALGQVEEKIRTCRNMEIVVDLIERPADIRTEFDRVISLSLAFVKGLQTYVELNKDRIRDSGKIQEEITSLCGVLAERARHGTAEDR